MGYILEEIGDVVSAAVGPRPRISVVIEHARHDVVYARIVDETLALKVVVVRHVQP